MVEAAVLHATVVYSPGARNVVELSVQAPAGSTLQVALALSGIWAQYPELAGSVPEVGVWGKLAADLTQRLQDGDRIEIYRPLTVDPKVARRTRFKGQGARATGLFAQKRQGAKAGYGG